MDEKVTKVHVHQGQVESLRELNEEMEEIDELYVKLFFPGSLTIVSH